ncbi:MAG: hypothetical protein EOP10_14370 [Proteobacteria bacterium]|nr:MAG: hypothetical protein EOP10_14370 [Pseudomonadota bacterium]
MRNPESAIKAACGSSVASKAAYRFLRHEKVNPTTILSAHVENTKTRAKAALPRVLVIQDTTDLIYTQFPATQGLGQRLKAQEVLRALYEE